MRIKYVRWQQGVNLLETVSRGPCVTSLASLLVSSVSSLLIVPNLKCQIHFVPQLQRKPITRARSRPAMARWRHERHEQQTANQKPFIQVMWSPWTNQRLGEWDGVWEHETLSASDIMTGSTKHWYNWRSLPIPLVIRSLSSMSLSFCANNK